MMRYNLVQPCRGKPRRRGFTLTELLIVIAIIGILASMVMFAMAGAQEEARAQRTQAQILKIHQILAEQWESYETRRVPNIHPAYLTKLDTLSRRLGERRGVARNRSRLHGLRELMRLELPDRMTDVLDPPRILLAQPGKWHAYSHRVEHTQESTNQSWSPLHESAECLYMILSQIQDGDSNALEFFAEKEIGDVDNDGMREVLDAWGVPIRWLRWAPGFVSTLQNTHPTILAGPHTGEPNPTFIADIFDPALVDVRHNDTDNNNASNLPGVNDPFQLFPLIISSGPDKQFGIGFVHGQKQASFRASITNPPNDPYHWPFGEVVDPRAAGDDIHNHIVETN